MTSENKIDALQLCSLIIMISLSGFLGSGFYCLIKAALNNGYLSIVIGGAIAIIRPLRIIGMNLVLKI